MGHHEPSGGYEAVARACEKFLDAMHETAQANAELVIARVEEIDGPVHEFERGEMLVEAQRRLHAACLESTLAVEASIEEFRNLRDAQ